ncbi:expressed unknown protein [Seminavis robusta]|uniref:Uncharacterized protein n=1 Tax=Seminavis robusta TaxID=568900 RepID=A0A9N8DSN4_9STRA|nr:expressed unknown protein [Seminavis robusta]CAB9522275.1 expressed unknown protein [Seminavis robusta]|eukprot:Sro1286_g259371.1  (254) ;mRNA; f:15034-15795
MLHAKAMAVVVAYDIYLEACEGKLQGLADCRLNKPVSFYRFREKLAKQMLEYAPRHCRYLGDEKMRDTTSTPKAKRKRSRSPQRNNNRPADDELTTASGVSLDTFSSNNHGDRLCGFITPLLEHYESCNTMANKKKLNCVFCGKPAYQYCELCGKAVHKHPQEKIGNGRTSCFLHYHNTAAMGLARDDWKITGKRLKDWSYPTATEFEDNEQQMKRLLDEIGSRSSSNNSGTNSGGSSNNSHGSDTQQATPQH